VQWPIASTIGRSEKPIFSILPESIGILPQGQILWILVVMYNSHITKLPECGLWKAVVKGISSAPKARLYTSPA
jgi:hypothetical protein